MCLWWGQLQCCSGAKVIGVFVWFFVALVVGLVMLYCGFFLLLMFHSGDYMELQTATPSPLPGAISE